MQNNYNFFNNNECKYFPCHQGIATEEFNCLFCFCPLYFFKNCQGKPTYLANNLKDCSSCPRPHNISEYAEIIKQIKNCVNTSLTEVDLKPPS